MHQGLLIVFEGIDGTGKTTQIRLLNERLNKMGLDVVATREPTDGKYGLKIRQLFADRRSCSLQEELDLFIEDRKEHVQKVIQPALAAGKIVVSDRYYLSTAAYQGAAGHDPDEIIAMNEKFAPRPDLVLHLVLPVEESLHRIQHLRNETLNDFEKEESLRKVAGVFDGFQYDYIKKIDATQNVDAVHECVMVHVQELLAKHQRLGNCT